MPFKERWAGIRSGLHIFNGHVFGHFLRHAKYIWVRQPVRMFLMMKLYHDVI